MSDDEKEFLDWWAAFVACHGSHDISKMDQITLAKRVWESVNAKKDLESERS